MNIKQAQIVEKDINPLTDNIPYGYIELNLSSKGKLSAPRTIHLRNYNSADVLELASKSEDALLESSIHVLSNLILEKVDVSLFTEKEVMEIYLSLYANWWGDSLKEMVYPMTKEDEEALENKPELLKRYKEGSWYPTVDIPISKIEVKELAEEFKEPLVFKSKTQDLTLSLRISRLQDGITAKKYVREKYLSEEYKFKTFEKKLAREEITGYDKSIGETEREEYNNYLMNKSFDLIKALQACLIVDDISFEEKISIVETLDSKLWLQYNNFIKKYPFGICEDIEVISPITDKPEIRRFQFRPLDFFPTDDEKNLNEYDISFG